jgi:hypothetical protein
MQMEDPRKQWRIEQEKMLKDYLMVSQHNLQVCTFTSNIIIFLMCIRLFVPDNTCLITVGIDKKGCKNPYQVDSTIQPSYNRSL